MSPFDRKRLESKVDATVARMYGAEIPPFTDPLHHVGMISEGSPLVLLDRDDAIRALEIVGADNLIEEAFARRSPMSLVVVVFVEEMATVAFMRLGIGARAQA